MYILDTKREESIIPWFWFPILKMSFRPCRYYSMVRAWAHILNYLRLILVNGMYLGCKFSPWHLIGICVGHPIQSVSLTLMFLSLTFPSTFSKIQRKKYPQVRSNDKENVRPRLFHKAKQWARGTSKSMNWKPVNSITTVTWDQHIPGTGSHFSVSLKQKSGHSLKSMSKLVIKRKLTTEGLVIPRFLQYMKPEVSFPEHIRPWLLQKF